MYKIILFSFAFLFTFQNFAQNNPSQNGEGVYLSFITVNGYGNNLYLDNITAGTRFNNDVGVVSINNIKKDTSYTVGTSPFNIIPNVSIINSGMNNVTTPFNVTMTVTPGTYSSIKSVSSLNSGAMHEVLFDLLTITPGEAITINVTTALAGDEYESNNILNQFSIVYSGVQRNVLLEQWTSSTCAPCASNNPTIDAFVSSNFNSLSAIKYHVGWPSPGNDPMYLYNPTQSYDRRYYYGINAVPHVIMDGLIHPAYPYSTPNSLPDAFNSRTNVGSPVSIEVTDTRIPGDSIQADIEINILAPLMFGEYFLRVHAIERKIQYSTAPGSNGETIFYDVFRKAFPGSEGISLNTATGQYHYVIKYPVDMAAWVDSMIYTTAFIQNDLTKEVINSGKARNYTKDFNLQSFPPIFSQKPFEAADDFIIKDAERITGTKAIGNFYYELFEGDFPPSNWTVVNPDGGLTFQQYTGANGPAFNGTKSVTLEFYSYSTTGQADTMYAGPFSGLLETDSIKFDYAYAQYSATYIDRLIVKASNDGGVTYPFTIFDKAGSSLATAPVTTGSFVPTANQWVSFSYSLEGIVPVELISFSGNIVDGNVLLKWSTASELNNYGFEIQRSYNGSDFVSVGFVDGAGTTIQQKEYSFSDKLRFKGSVYYRLKQIDFDGKFSYSETINVTYEKPLDFSLSQNYPNPFNPHTSIMYSLGNRELVTLKLYDITGQEIKTLVNEIMDAGNYSISLDASSLASGIYLVRMVSGSFSSVKKINLLK